MRSIFPQTIFVDLAGTHYYSRTRHALHFDKNNTHTRNCSDRCCARFRLSRVPRHDKNHRATDKKSQTIWHVRARSRPLEDWRAVPNATSNCGGLRSEDFGGSVRGAEWTRSITKRSSIRPYVWPDASPDDTPISTSGRDGARRERWIRNCIQNDPLYRKNILCYINWHYIRAIQYAVAIFRARCIQRFKAFSLAFPAYYGNNDNICHKNFEIR